MKTSKNQGTKSMWRWYCGGSVIAVAVVIGCASAVEFRDSGREAGAAKRGIAAEHAEGYMHNGGKPTMPVSASFDGDMIANINRETTLIVAIRAESDISSVRGSITGIEGLDGRVTETFTLPQLAAGETQSFPVRVPAVTGSLAVSIEGLVGGAPMSTTLELKINPKAVSASDVGSGAVTSTRSRDMVAPPVRDSSGQVIQPMKAREN